jgi:hypothetical protein
MNLEDYQPSTPVDDRRRSYTRPRRPPAGLLDMLNDPNFNNMPGAYRAPAPGLADEAGYNLIGRQPMPRYAPVQGPPPSPAMNNLYQQRWMGGTGGPVRYPGMLLDY